MPPALPCHRKPANSPPPTFRLATAKKSAPKASPTRRCATNANYANFYRFPTILLDVVNIFIDDAIVQDSMIQADQLDAIGKLGGDLYSTTRDRFALKRP
jgi:hypothetical protein